MKAIFQVISICFLIFSNDAFTQSEGEWSKAINVSGRQRMLSQKMAKEYALILLGVESDENLKATISLFDASLNNLINGGDGIPKAPNEKILAQLNKVKGLWSGYKADLQSPDKSKLDKVMSSSLVVLKEMNKGVKMYETSSIKAGLKGKGKVINIAGRQRMLSQKMSKEVFFIALGHKPEKLKKDLNKTVNLFNTSLDALMNGSKKMRISAPSSDEIKGQLSKVNGLWTEFKGLVTKDTYDDALIKSIASKNPTLLKEMNKAVGMY